MKSLEKEKPFQCVRTSHSFKYEMWCDTARRRLDLSTSTSLVHIRAKTNNSGNCPRWLVGISRSVSKLRGHSQDAFSRPVKSTAGKAARSLWLQTGCKSDTATTQIYKYIYIHKGSLKYQPELQLRWYTSVSVSGAVAAARRLSAPWRSSALIHVPTLHTYNLFYVQVFRVQNVLVPACSSVALHATSINTHWNLQSVLNVKNEEPVWRLSRISMEKDPLRR